MKRKRIQYNEVNEEIYDPTYWKKSKLIFIGIIILFFGFLFNFSLEEKINKALVSILSSNQECPILFDKADITFFLPKIYIKNPTISGNCFGQPSNKLKFQFLSIAIKAPSFYPPGIKLHLSAREDQTEINIYPVISPFSQYIDIENTTIDTAIFAPFSGDNKSVIAGNLTIDGSLKFSSGKVEDGKLHIHSSDFYIPSQNIKGFEMTQLDIKHLDIDTHFTNKTTMQIDRVEIGIAGSPIKLNLKGNLLINMNYFANSQLQLSGTLKLSEYILTNFSFIKLFLPSENTSGSYQMKINGPLGNPGTPQIK